MNCVCKNRPVICGAMDDLIKLVRTYRYSGGVADRVRLAEEICRQIEPRLLLFVLGFIQMPDAEIVLGHSVKAIIGEMKKFEPRSTKQFWTWCFRIARIKISQRLRERDFAESQPRFPEELRKLLERAGNHEPLSPGVKYAMKMLAASQADAYEFLWRHFIFEIDYSDIADECCITYDDVRTKIKHSLDEAQKHVN